MNRSERLKEYWRQVRAGERQPPKRGERNGTIKRKLRCQSNWLKGGEVILTVYPHGELGFREPHRRAEYKLSLTEAFRQAVVITTSRIAVRVKALRKEGYGMGEARRKARKEAL